MPGLCTLALCIVVMLHWEPRDSVLPLWVEGSPAPLHSQMNDSGMFKVSTVRDVLGLFVCCCCFVRYRDKDVEGPLSNVLFARKDTLDGFKCWWSYKKRLEKQVEPSIETHLPYWEGYLEFSIFFRHGQETHELTKCNKLWYAWFWGT